MNVKNLLEATADFNPNYQCFYCEQKKNLPISNIHFDKKEDSLYLISLHSNALKLNELKVVCKPLPAHTKIFVKTSTGKYPIFGFKINGLKLEFA